jgi:hypothetical protein
MADSRTVVGATRARQGRFGRHMVWVLVFSTLLAAVGLFAAWTWKAPQLARATANNPPSAAAAAFNAPQPPAPTPHNGGKAGAPTP